MTTREQAMDRWQGVLAPIVTPFAENGDLDLAQLRVNVQWLIDQGANDQNTVILTAGSGGDFTSMTIEERKQVIEATVNVVNGTIPVIAGVQCLDIRECIALCQFCEQIGVDAVQISGPFYYDGRPNDVTAWMAEVARHTNIGFAIYNNWYTGYDMPLDLIDALIELPNAIAVKWSSPNVDLFQEGIRRWNGKVAVVNNTFNTILGHLAGSRVFVSHWPNFYPQFCWRIWDLMERHDYAQAHQEFEEAMVPYQRLVAQIAAQTGGEGIFVRPAMRAVGLNGGISRFPSRDAAVTPEIQAGFDHLLASMTASPSASRAGRD